VQGIGEGWKQGMPSMRTITVERLLLRKRWRTSRRLVWIL